MLAGWSGHQVVDPSELQDRFSTEDGIGSFGSIFTDPSEESLLKIERIRYILDSLPPREADFIDLFYLRGMRQTTIAKIFAVSQPTVCYRLRRAIARIQFLLKLPDITEDKMTEDLSGILSDPLDIRIMILMYLTTCQSEVAKIIGKSQGFVRHRYMRSIDRIMAAGDTYYGELFDYIQSNLNILREVRRASEGEEKTTIVLR